MILFWLIPITFILGPAGASAFAFSQGLTVIETGIAITAIHIALVPVWFEIFKLLKYELYYKNRFVYKVLERTKVRTKIKPVIERKLQEFEAKVGQFGLATTVIGFTFLFGVSWAAMGAYLLNIKTKTVMVAVTIGAIISSLFWTLVFAGLGWFVPSPWVIYLIGTIVTFLILSGEKLKEKRLLKEMSKSLKRLVSKKYPPAVKPKKNEKPTH